MAPTQSQRLEELETTVTSMVERINSVDLNLAESRDQMNSSLSSMEASLNSRLSVFDSRFSSLESLLRQLTMGTTTKPQLNDFVNSQVYNKDNVDFRMRQSPVPSDSGQHVTEGIRLGQENLVDSSTDGQRGLLVNNQFDAFGGDRRDTSVRKIEMPVFEGVNVYGWLARIEHFFRVGNYIETEKLRMVSLCLDGPALSWFNWRLSRLPFTGWADFKSGLLDQFSTQAALGRRLFGLKQTGSLAEFITEFHELSAQAPHLTDLDLEHIFVNGLKPALQDLVIMLNPQGLTSVISAAIRLEPSTIYKVVDGACKSLLQQDQSMVVHRGQNKSQSNSSWRTRTIGDNHSSNSASVAGSASGMGRPPVVHRSENVRGRLYLTDEEYSEKRRKGICFTCSDKFFPGHKCPNKYLQVLIIIDGCEVELVEDPLDGEITTFPTSPECFNLTLCSFLGLPSYSTTKVEGKIGRCSVVIMLDSGATHNFISPCLADKLRLKSATTSGRDVLLGNGFKVPSLGIFRAVEFVIGNIHFSAYFCVLELGGADVIFGIQWLETLGDCKVNWAQHRLSFQYNGSLVTLQGDPALRPHPVSLRTLAAAPMPSLPQEDCHVLKTQKQLQLVDLPASVSSILEEF